MTFKFPPRGPDTVSEAIADVLSTKRPLEFKEIFDLVYASLRSNDLAKTGEEMLRLRAHEKLQAFVVSGIATKTQKKYTGVPTRLKEFIKAVAEHKAKVASGLPFHPGPPPKESAVASPKALVTKSPGLKLKPVKSKAVRTR